MKLNSKSLQQIVVKMNFIYTHENVDFKIHDDLCTYFS